MDKSAFARAIEIVGGQTRMAQVVSSRQSTIWSVLHRNRSPVPAEWCLPIERATDSQVTRYDLRPDVFGIPSDDDAPTPGTDRHLEHQQVIAKRAEGA